MNPSRADREKYVLIPDGEVVACADFVIAAPLSRRMARMLSAMTSSQLPMVDARVPRE
jgi:hypothetical protein